MSAEKNPPVEPASDECIERWQVQVDCDPKIVIVPILRRDLAAILARLAKAEADLLRLDADHDALATDFNANQLDRCRVMRERWEAVEVLRKMRACDVCGSCCDEACRAKIGKIVGEE